MGNSIQLIWVKNVLCENLVTIQCRSIFPGPEDSKPWLARSPLEQIDRTQQCDVYCTGRYFFFRLNRTPAEFKMRP